MGNTVWAKVFASTRGKDLYGDTIYDEDVCPLQLRRIVFSQLAHYAKILEDKQYEGMAGQAQNLHANTSAEWRKKRKVMRDSSYGRAA